MNIPRRRFLKGSLSAGVALVAGSQLVRSLAFADKLVMTKQNGTFPRQMRYFMDTHDRARGTFPEKLSREDLEAFYRKYEKACYDEGVIPVTLHVGYGEGRAFCLTLAPDAAAVKRAHARAGLPFDEITEVKAAAAGDTFFRKHAA
ncbi:DUF4242 domain-containing protein [Trichlorobacter lovleyi]|uniref:DUF4242 domain-containing protein n=1 Tax=Trichlorobacter lovleyi TaxID=313985 RepID=UPI00223FFAC9|nr:DUF4242 domain-containing protein [Trichlorobacter lovleyi]